MDTVTVVHPTGAPDVLEFESRALAVEFFEHSKLRCQASLGARTIKRSWDKDVVIEGAKETGKRKKK